MNAEITLRIAEEADAPELVKIYAPYVEDTAVSFEYDVPSAEKFAGRMRAVLRKYPYIVAESEGKILGYSYVGAFNPRAAYDWSVETTIYLRTDVKRRGIGSLLYDAMEELLKKQGILNLNACIGYPDTEDAHLTRDSVKFHEKRGFRMVGEFHDCGYKFDRWYSMVWMEKIIGSHAIPQPPIKPFPDIRAEAGSILQKYSLPQIDK
jgi:L-amino acid N-acyltransferase YncA